MPNVVPFCIRTPRSISVDIFAIFVNNVGYIASNNSVPDLHYRVVFDMKLGSCFCASTVHFINCKLM